MLLPACRGESLDNLDSARPWRPSSWTSGPASYSRPQSSFSGSSYSRFGASTLPTSLSTGSLRQNPWPPASSPSPPAGGASDESLYKNHPSSQKNRYEQRLTDTTPNVCVCSTLLFYHSQRVSHMQQTLLVRRDWGQLLNPFNILQQLTLALCGSTSASLGLLGSPDTHETRETKSMQINKRMDPSIWEPIP